MRLKQIKIAGFRGFNDERVIDFHDRLTLISAPNSHGKTSITEALELLIFGETSKVAHAHSKEEYRDSYRNRHYPPSRPAIIEAKFEDESEGAFALEVQIDSAGKIRRTMNGSLVSEWPFASKMADAASPFVLQHALKNLLLVPPSERFQGFARLLGLYDLDLVQQAIVNVCTKPAGSISESAKGALADVLSLAGRLTGFSELCAAGEGLSEGTADIATVYVKVHARAATLLGRKEDPDRLLSALVDERDKQVSRIYGGTVALKTKTQSENARLSLLRDKLAAGVSAQFIEAYAYLGVHDATERLRKETQFLGIGKDLLMGQPDTCPFCGQGLTEELRQHIGSRHANLKTQIAELGGEPDRRIQMGNTFSSLRSSITDYQQLLEERSAGLLESVKPQNKAQLISLFGNDHEASWRIVESAGSTVSSLIEELRAAETRALNAITKCETSLQNKQEDVSQAESLADALQRYLSGADQYSKKLDELDPSLAGPSRVLRQAIDASAGTTELSVLIDLVEKKATIERVARAREVLEALKELKKFVDQTVGEVMESAIGTDLAGSVMTWYEKIRTQGDPDVHFSGFAMEKTKAGDFKNRRVKVGAKSYGIELSSAVSSLSESKLNALGLCITIATALRAPGPWEFLILDDPIQSWDEDHELQFIDVLRSLAVTEKKQVILLSHRSQWINQVSLGCRSINGIRYQITGYTKDGPILAIGEWAPADQRLREVHSIISDKNASSVRLQQAEEEIRLAACQLGAEIAKNKLGRVTSPHNMNSKFVRGILNEAGCPVTLVDKVVSTFGTTDDAHHAPKDYQPNSERIRQYHGILHELKNWMEGK